MIKYIASKLHALKQWGFFTALFGAAFSNSVCGIGLGIYVVSFLLEIFLEKTEPRPSFPQWKFVVPLLLSLLVSLFISDFLWVSTRGFWKYLEGFILLYAGIDVVRDRKSLQAFIFIFLSTYFLAATAGVYQEIVGVDYLYGRTASPHQGDLLRLSGSFKHCNDYATFLIGGFIGTLALFISALQDKKFRNSVLYFILLSLISYTVMRTLSRSAILSLSAGLLFFSLFFRFRWFAIGSILAGLCLICVIPSPLQDRMIELFSFKGNMSERVLLVKTTIRMIEVNPFFGLGLNTYSDYFPQFKPPDYPALMYSHNTYLQMATESGLLGLCLHSLFIMALLFPSVKALAKCEDKFIKIFGIGIASGAVAILTNGLFESVLQSTQLRTLFWILLGITVALASARFTKPHREVSA